jgi:nuclear pore complex protein Nup88
MPTYFCRYIAADDGNIRCCEVRQQLLSGEWASPSATDAAASCPTPTISTMQPLPELDLTITSFSLNQSGTHAIAGGPTLADPELSAVYLLDIAARRSHPKGQSSTKSADLLGIPLDEALFTSHPGLRVLQITWHPHSDRHVAILTSDAAWRLYDVMRPDLAEQTFELQPSRGRRGLGLDVEHVYSSPVAFSFGQGLGWDMFAIYFLLSNGSVSILCPVAPFGARYPSHSIASLQEGLEELSVDIVETAEAWLQRAFQPVSSYLPGGGGSIGGGGGATGEEEIHVPELHVCRPHALDDHSPAFVGPLLVSTAEDGNNTSNHKSPLPGPTEALLMWRFSGVCTAVAIASAKGPVAVHLLAGGAIPCWHSAPPQCVVEGLDLRAVRCQAASVSSSAHDSIAPQLLLIDLIRLNPPQLNGGQFDDDSDDDDDDRSNSQLSTFQQRGGGSNGHSVRTPGSLRVSLQLDLSSSDTLYSIYPGQAYSISLPWLPVLADYLTTTAVEGGSSSGSRLPDALPSAKAEELDGPSSPGVGAVAAAAVGDALCSSALLVLYNDGSTKCLRPHGAVSISSNTTTTTAEKATTAFERTSSAAKIEANLKETEAQIQRIYGEVLHHTTQNTTIPRVGSAQLGTPTGTRALADAISALRSCHVEFAHRAHHDLAERLGQLKSEVQAQEERADRISALAQQAETQRGKLTAAVERSVWLASNISRRLHLLAELHWALPRPASTAEVAFKKEELPAMEEAARRLGNEVTSVAGRVTAIQRGIKPMSVGGGKVSSGGSNGQALPHSQLRQVRELLSEHDRAIRLAKEKAAALEDALMNATVGV